MRLLEYVDLNTFWSECGAFVLKNTALNLRFLTVLTKLKPQMLLGKTVYLVACFSDNGCEGVYLNCPSTRLICLAGNTSAANFSFISSCIKKNFVFSGCCGGETVEDFVKEWQRCTGEKASLYRKLIHYQFIKKTESLSLNPAGKVRLATNKDFDYLCAWRKMFLLETGERVADLQAIKAEVKEHILQKVCYLLDSGEPSAVLNAFHLKGDIVKIAGVYTPKHRRGLGYAQQLVCAVSTFLSDQGKTCYIEADESNPVSNWVYQKVGYKKVGEFFDYVFL